MANGTLGADNGLENSDVVGNYQMEEEQESKSQIAPNPTTTNDTPAQTDYSAFISKYCPTRKEKLALLHSLLTYFSAGLTDIEMAIPALDDTKRTAGFYVPAGIRYKERHSAEFTEELRRRAQVYTTRSK